MRPGNRLRELRKAAGLTQTELAVATGVSQPAISQIENGERPLDVPWMRAFARVLGCAPVDLLDEVDNPYRLDDEERALVEDYRSASADQRELTKRVAAPVIPFRPRGAEDEAA